MKYYAVRRGRKTGIFTRLSDYNAAVQGFAGAESRGFSTEKDAVAYLRGTPPFHRSSPPTIRDPKSSEVGRLPCAYTDGSFREEINICGYGVVIREGAPDLSVRTKEFCGFVRHSAFEVVGSTAAELIAVLKAVEYAGVMQFDSLRICTDSATVIQWANSISASPLADWFSRELGRISHGISLSFEKVEGHKGIVLNERADELAREGANGMVRAMLLEPIRMPVRQSKNKISARDKSQLNVHVEPQLRELLKCWCTLNGLTQSEAVEHLISAGCRQMLLPDCPDME